MSHGTVVLRWRPLFGGGEDRNLYAATCAAAPGGGAPSSEGARIATPRPAGRGCPTGVAPPLRRGRGSQPQSPVLAGVQEAVWRPLFGGGEDRNTSWSLLPRPRFQVAPPLRRGRGSQLDQGLRQVGPGRPVAPPLRRGRGSQRQRVADGPLPARRGAPSSEGARIATPRPTSTGSSPSGGAPSSEGARIATDPWRWSGQPGGQVAPPLRRGRGSQRSPRSCRCGRRWGVAPPLRRGRGSQRDAGPVGGEAEGGWRPLFGGGEDRNCQTIPEPPEWVPVAPPLRRGRGSQQLSPHGGGEGLRGAPSSEGARIATPGRTGSCRPWRWWRPLFGGGEDRNPRSYCGHVAVRLVAPPLRRGRGSQPQAAGVDDGRVDLVAPPLRRGRGSQLRSELPSVLQPVLWRPLFGGGEDRNHASSPATT